MFVRDPVVGAVKTRLAVSTGGGEAAALYAAFVDDLCGALSPRFRMTIACTPDAGSPYFRRLAARHDVTLTPQGGGDLGARMERVVRTALADAARVVVIGSDAPTLPAAYVARAFAALRRTRVVLGPSLDGGYYLVGVRAPVAPIFRRMRWSDAAVLARTLRRLARARVPHTLLPCWYDVDTRADLELLRRHLAVAWCVGERIAPRTRRVLRRLGRSRGGG